MIFLTALWTPLPKWGGNTFQDSNDLDMGVWFQKAKVLVSASEIIKTPKQKETLMNVISPPPPKKVTFKGPLENAPPS